MANYKTHSYFNLLLALPLLVFLFTKYLSVESQFIITFGLAFAYSSLFMTPDLDISDKIKLISIRGFFSIPFRLYAKFFRHRGLSHHIVLGSISRIVWLLIFFTLLAIALNYALPTPYELLGFYKKYKPYIFFTILGIFLSDMCHLLLDKLKKR